MNKELLNENEVEKNVEAYIMYVQTFLNKVKQYSDPLSQVHEIGIHEIKSLLKNRLDISNTLTSEKERKLVELRFITRKYKIWYAEKYSIKRGELNPRDLAGTKYLSTKEIDQEVINSHKDEWLFYQEKMDNLQGKVDMLEGLLKSWNSTSFDMNVAQKLLEMEYTMQGKLSNYANGNIPQRGR